MLKPIVALTAVSVLTLTALAQTPSVPLAYTQGQDLIIEAGTNRITVPVAQDYPYDNNPTMDLEWSPDGRWLAYIQLSEVAMPEGYTTSRADLFAISVEGGTPITIAEGISAGFPVAWTQDGALLYAQDDPASLNATSPGDWLVNLYRAEVLERVAPVQLGQTPFIVGCGGGMSFPDDVRYLQEAGFGGSPVKLMESAVGIILSVNCAGQGVQRLSDGVLLDEGLARWSLSADGTQVVGVRLNYTDTALETRLQVLDLTTGDLRDIATQAMPDQVYWAADGTIYYSSREASAELFSPEQSATILQTQGLMADPAFTTALSAFTVRLHRLDVTTGAETEVFSVADASWIGRIRGNQDSLYLSVIDSLRLFGEAALAGQITLENSYTEGMNLVGVEVYRFELATGETTLINPDFSMSQVEVAPSLMP